MITADTINEEVIRAVYRLLAGMGRDYVGGFDVNKIVIVPTCEGGEAAHISTKDAYNDDGQPKPDLKPDTMTICMDAIRRGVKDSLGEWGAEFPGLISTWGGAVNSAFLRSVIGAVLAVILSDAAAHEDRHRKSPPDIDPETGEKTPTLSDEGAAESAGHTIGDRLSDLLYKDLDQNYLYGNDANDVFASLDLSASTLGGIPSVDDDKVDELIDLFSNDIFKDTLDGKIRRQD
jgi:hypothetical protein